MNSAYFQARRTANRIAAIAVTACAMACALVSAPAQAQAPSLGKPGAYYISEFEVTDPDGIRPYSAAVESTFVPFGGRYVVRGGRIASREGEPAKRVIMITFPSMERAQAWYDSEAYRAIRPIRHKSAKSRVFILEALPD